MLVGGSHSFDLLPDIVFVLLLVSKQISSVGHPEGVFKKLTGSSQDAVKSGRTQGSPPPPKSLEGGHLEIDPSKKSFFFREICDFTATCEEPDMMS